MFASPEKVVTLPAEMRKNMTSLDTEQVQAAELKKVFGYGLWPAAVGKDGLTGLSNFPEWPSWSIESKFF